MQRKRDQEIQVPPTAGNMAERVRAFDWAATSLGAIEGWPASLRTAAGLMLAAPQIASLVVGSERLFLYNDKAARHYGARHPRALGLPIAASQVKRIR